MQASDFSSAWVKRSGRLFIGAAGVLWCAAATQGALVSRNVNVTLNASNLDSYNLDVDQDGTTDFTLEADYVPDPVLTVGFDQFVFPFGTSNAVVIDTQSGDGFPAVSLLAAGATVSSTSLFSGPNDEGDLYFDDTIDPTTGNFDGQTGDVGLRFTSGGNTYYGFAQITVTNENSATAPLNLTIGQVFYNNVAGQAAVVPEPASMAMVGGLGLAAAGVLRRRRYGSAF